MLVWDSDKYFVYVRKVYYIIAPDLKLPFPVITYDPYHKTQTWRSCAYIPKGVDFEPKDIPYNFDDT